jgi:hypothetical protein
MAMYVSFNSFPQPVFAFNFTPFPVALLVFEVDARVTGSLIFQQHVFGQ